MDVIEAVKKRRTIRKFTSQPVTEEQLLTLTKCAGLSATGANMQPLKFAVITSGDIKDKIFPLVKWAGYLQNGAPKQDERPSAYIAVLQDTSIKRASCEVDAGSAVSAMMLAAVDMGLGTCWMGAIDRPAIKKVLALPDTLEVMYILSIGYPAQESVAFTSDESVKYYEDENGVIHVPKRSPEKIVLKF